MKENFYDKYATVLAGMNEEDAEYILRCVSEPGREMKHISELLDGFYRDVLATSELLNKAEKLFNQSCGKISAIVKKYNDTLTTEGIWNSVDAAEAKKKLNTFYSLLSAVEKLEGSDAPHIGIEELTKTDMEIGKRISLLKRAAFMLLENDKTEAEKIASKYKLCHSTAEEMIRKNAVFFEKTRHNEAVLGKYVSSLALALDEKNKGERMNLSFARNCVEVFFANYITEK